jgi:hypothetical protein
MELPCHAGVTPERPLQMFHAENAGIVHRVVIVAIVFVFEQSLFPMATATATTIATTNTRARFLVRVNPPRLQMQKGGKSPTAEAKKTHATPSYQ